MSIYKLYPFCCEVMKFLVNAFDGTEDDHIKIVAVVLGVADKSDLADKSLYPDLEEVHAKEIRKFNREHRNED